MAQVLPFGRTAIITYLSDNTGKKDPFCAAKFGGDLREL
jgi:hypothetical protein